MTLAKAIEFLQFLLKEHPRIESADFGSAIKLGIEALKEFECLREDCAFIRNKLLPGEDSQ